MKEDEKRKLKNGIVRCTKLIIGIPLLVAIAFILVCCVIILWERFFVFPAEPQIKHGEFPFELVYKYNGVEYTLEDSIICDYGGIDYVFDGGNYRVWTSKFEENMKDGCYYIDKENNPHLYIYVPADAEYYMGEIDADNPEIPYIEFDLTYGEEIGEEDIENVDFEIIKWTPAEPIKNVFDSAN